MGPPQASPHRATAAGLAAPAPASAPAKRAPDPLAGIGPVGPVDAKTNTIGNLFYGSKGYLGIDGYDSYKTWLTEQVKPGPSASVSGDHFANFIDCVRSRKAEDIHSPIEEAHISTTLVHLANASYRLGRMLRFDPVKEQVINDDEANRMLHGTYRAPFVVPDDV